MTTHSRNIGRRAAEGQQRAILLMAKYISIIFTPFYLPLMGLIALFAFSYLSMMPLFYKLYVLLTVYFFTILLPTTLIHIYRKYQGWSLLRLFSREGRMIPYVISIMSYLTCFYIMNTVHFPHFMSENATTAPVVPPIAAVWVDIFQRWFCVLLILAGVVGTGRMLLRLHSLGEITGGYLVGLFAGAAAVLAS